MKLSAEAQSFEDASPEQQEAFWKRVGEWAERETDFKRWLAAMDDPTDPDPEPPMGRLLPKPRWNPSRAKPLELGEDEADPDLLAAMSPREYWERLTGESVPSHGRVQCPAPDHPDENPACVVYAEPGRGWHCHACGAGGSAIDLAACLTGIRPRGKGYFDLLRWIGERI